MFTANFFQAHKELKKEMGVLFKEKGYATLKEKREFLKNLFGEVKPLTDMTISEMEKVIESLSKKNSL